MKWTREERKAAWQAGWLTLVGVLLVGCLTVSPPGAVPKLSKVRAPIDAQTQQFLDLRKLALKQSPPPVPVVGEATVPKIGQTAPVVPAVHAMSLTWDAPDQSTYGTNARYMVLMKTNLDDPAWRLLGTISSNNCSVDMTGVPNAVFTVVTVSTNGMPSSYEIIR